DHTAYDYAWIVEHSSLVVDTRNATRLVKSGREKVIKAWGAWSCSATQRVLNPTTSDYSPRIPPVCVCPPGPVALLCGSPPTTNRSRRPQKRRRSIAGPCGSS